MYRRPMFQTLLARLQERCRFLQVLAGPRQAGKTTLAQKVLEACPPPPKPLCLRRCPEPPESYLGSSTTGTWRAC